MQARQEHRAKLIGPLVTKRTDTQGRWRLAVQLLTFVYSYISNLFTFYEKLSRKVSNLNIKYIYWHLLVHHSSQNILAQFCSLTKYRKNAQEIFIQKYENSTIPS